MGYARKVPRHSFPISPVRSNKRHPTRRPSADGATGKKRRLCSTSFWTAGSATKAHKIGIKAVRRLITSLGALKQKAGSQLKSSMGEREASGVISGMGAAACLTTTTAERECVRPLGAIMDGFT